MLPHVNFWVVAYILLVVIFYFSRRQLITVFSLPVDISLGPPLLNALIIGIVYGTGNGLLDYFFESRMFRNKPLGKLIILKAIVSLGLMMACFALLRYVSYNFV